MNLILLLFCMIKRTLFSRNRYSPQLLRSFTPSAHAHLPFSAGSTSPPHPIQVLGIAPRTGQGSCPTPIPNEPILSHIKIAQTSRKLLSSPRCNLIIPSLREIHFTPNYFNSFCLPFRTSTLSLPSVGTLTRCELDWTVQFSSPERISAPEKYMCFVQPSTVLESWAPCPVILRKRKEGRFLSLIVSEFGW